MSGQVPIQAHKPIKSQQGIFTMKEPTKRMRNPVSIAVQVALLATAPATMAVAQDTGADDLYIDEIIVTSRKRNETLVEVPMNIATVDSQEILARNLLTKEDVFRTIAGAAAPRGQLILRGLSGGNDSTPDTTSVWTDDIPFDTSDLFDVERIEVLRGPQGTLYGSNAIGGTVRIITKKPVMNDVEAFGAGVMNTEANRSGVGTRVYAGVNIPIIEDTLAARIIGSYGSRDGKIMNTFTGTPGRESDSFLRAQVLWEPTDEWSLNFSFMYEQVSDSGYDWADRSQPGYYYEAVLTENPLATYGYDVIIPGIYDWPNTDFPTCPNPTDERPACRLGGQISSGHDPKFSVWETIDPYEDENIGVYAVRIAKDNIFEGADLVYSGSYHVYDYDGLQNWSRNDANDMFRTWIIDIDGYDRNAHELRLQSNTDSPLQWIVGGYYDESDWLKSPNIQWQYHAADNRSRAIAEYLWGNYWGYTDPTQLGLDLYGDGTKNYNYSVLNWNNRETAFFGELSYTFEFDNGGSLELMGGIRNYDLKDDIHTQASGIWIDASGAIQDDHTIDGEDGNRYKFSASYMPNDAVSVFFVYSEGYRPGGNNGPNAPQDCSADENIGSYTDRYLSDQIENYEIGIKGLAFDRRFQFSSAVYQIDWTGVQASVYMPTCGFSYTANAATAESRGIEFESTTLLGESLSLQVNGSYTDSKMTSDVVSLGASSGDSMTMVPEYNFYVALDQQVNMFGRDGSIRLDVAGYGEYKSHFNTKPEDISPAYEVVALSGNLQVNDNARVGIYINNLLDEEIITYKRSRYRGGWALGNHYYFYGDERNISVRFDFDF